MPKAPAYDEVSQTRATLMDRSLTPRRGVVLRGAVVVLMAATAVSAAPARADISSWGMSTQEKQIYDYGPGGTNTGGSKPGTVLDTANPIELMNKIRRGSAMDDATPPGDAIDAALKELDAQNSGVSSQVKAP